MFFILGILVLSVFYVTGAGVQQGGLPADTGSVVESNSVVESSEEINSTSIGCWDCNDNNKESDEGPAGCGCDEYEKCKFYGTKSTVYNYDKGFLETKTDYCKDSGTLIEYYLDCWGEDSIEFEEKNCNDDDYYGNDIYYCTSNEVRKHRRYFDYACASSSCRLGTNWVDDTLVSKKGDEDYCKDRKNYGCTLCGWGDYDCDYNSECATDLLCMGPIGGAFDGCCKSGEIWDENNYVCKKPCECFNINDPCCDGCYYRPSSYICKDPYQTDYGCPDGEGTSYPGSDVNYRTNKKYCSGSSSLCSGSVSSWGSWSVYYYCTSDEYCTDDDSTCNICGYHTTYKCESDDVYWFDTCNNKEDIKQDCGVDYCGLWGANYCETNDVYHKRTCNDRGCSVNACFDNIKEEKEKVKECGDSGYTGSNYCYDNDVYKDYVNRGCSGIDCYENTEKKKQTECGVDSYSANYCYDNDVYRDFIDKGCSNNACFSTTTKQFVQDCGNVGCSNGKCNIACYQNSDCGTDGYIGSPSCSLDDVYQTWRAYTCNNPGTTSSSCSYTDTLKLKTDCGVDYCDAWGATYCKDEDEYYIRNCYDKGCLSGACFNNKKPEEAKARECGINGCNENTGKCNICYQNSDCGTPHWKNALYCSSDDVYDKWIIPTCANPGTVTSYCYDSETSQKKTECGVDSYGANYCKDDDVYRDFTDRGCLSNSCFETKSEQKYLECGGAGCENGNCKGNLWLISPKNKAKFSRYIPELFDWGVNPSLVFKKCNIQVSGDSYASKWGKIGKSLKSGSSYQASAKDWKKLLKMETKDSDGVLYWRVYCSGEGIKEYSNIFSFSFA